MTEAMALDKFKLNTPEEKERHRITIVNCGRIGLATACLFSDADLNAICFNSDPYITKRINEGSIVFSEQELNEMLKKNLTRRKLRATTDIREAVSSSDIIFFADEIPIDGKKRPIYTELEENCRGVGLNLYPGSLIIVQSILAPSITENLIIKTLERTSGLEAGVDFGLAYSPAAAPAGGELDYLRRGARIISAINEQSLKAAEAVLRLISNGEFIRINDIKTAEAAAVFSDIYQDVNVALSNELASFCEKMGIDYIEVLRAVNSQPHCYLSIPNIEGGRSAETPHLLISEAENIGIKLRMASLARRMNGEASKQAYNLIRDAIHSCRKNVKRAKIAILGASRSLREARGSQILELVRLLRKRGGKVSIFDPCFQSDELLQLGYPAEKTLEKVLEYADCLVIAVRHKEFERLSLGSVRAMMKKPPIIVDLANVIDPHKAEREGFIYRGLGRGIRKR